MRTHSKYYQPDIRDQFHIDGLIAADVYVFKKTTKGMYGIKKASIIAYNQLLTFITRLYPSSLFNWTLVPQDQKYKILPLCG